MLLCIPLAEIDGLTRERGSSQREAAAELAATYTGAQTLAGPFIVQPYVERWMEPQRDAQGRVVGQEARSKEMTHLVFPDTAAPRGQPGAAGALPRHLPHSVLHARCGAGGPLRRLRCGRAAAQRKGVARSSCKPPYVALHLSDLRGLDGSPALQLASETLRFQQRLPGVAEDAGLAGGIHAPLAGGRAGGLAGAAGRCPFI